MGWVVSVWAAPPKGVPVGLFRVYPELNLVAEWDDNIYKTQGDLEGDQLLRIKPTITLETHWKNNKVSLVYGGEVQRYRRLHFEDRSDHTFTANLDLSPHSTIDLGVVYNFSAKHDVRGSPGIFDDPNLPPSLWHEQSLKGTGKYTFNRFRFQMDLSRSFKEAQNNNLSSQNNFWDDMALTLMFALAPKTAVLVETGLINYYYDDDDSQNSRERRILGGLTWSISKITEGQFKIGYSDKRMYNLESNDSSVITMQSEMSWNPRVRTNVNFAASRNFSEGELGADHFIASDVKLMLDHKIRPWLGVNSTIGLTNSDYGELRNENIWVTGVGVNYDLPRWFVVNGNYSRTNKQSTEDEGEYGSNLFMISLTGAL